MRTIRASEIGTFLFCRRAWYYQGQGIPSENQAEMAAGSEIHRQHGRAVLRATLLRLIAYLLILLALVIVAVTLVTGAL